MSASASSYLEPITVTASSLVWVSQRPSEAKMANCILWSRILKDRMSGSQTTTFFSWNWIQLVRKCNYWWLDSQPWEDNLPELWRLPEPPSLSRLHSWPRILQPPGSSSSPSADKACGHMTWGLPFHYHWRKQLWNLPHLPPIHCHYHGLPKWVLFLTMTIILFRKFHCFYFLTSYIICLFSCL